MSFIQATAELQLINICGISDLKSAAGACYARQWKTAAAHALKGAVKASLVVGALYATNQMFSSSASLPVQTTQEFCSNLLAKGFEGRTACNADGWEKTVVPGMDPSKYTIVEHESSLKRCVAILTEAGRKSLPVSDTCREVWMTLGNQVTLWWDKSAKLWY